MGDKEQEQRQTAHTMENSNKSACVPFLQPDEPAGKSVLTELPCQDWAANGHHYGRATGAAAWVYGVRGSATLSRLLPGRLQ